MRRSIVLALTTGLLILAAPANASTSDVHERNVAFLLGLLGEKDLSQQVSFADGRTMTLGAAIHDAASRAGATDLAALAQPAVTELGINIGDIWVVEYGLGPCTITTGGLFDSPLPYLPVHGQMYIYDGYFGTISTNHGYYTMIIGWTSKQSTMGFNTAGFTATGISDMYCFEFFDEHFAFPFVNGIAMQN